MFVPLNWLLYFAATKKGTKTMSRVLVVDDGTQVTRALVKLLAESAPMIIRANSYMDEIKPTNFTPDREYGWYRKFEKNGKKVP